VRAGFGAVCTACVDRLGPVSASFQPMTAAAARAFAATDRLTARILLWASACHSAIALALSWPRTRKRAG
jgi:hypothetical protein